jgi:oligopeptide/dipeptide ABC transporter ATP-binding protein
MNALLTVESLIKSFKVSGGVVHAVNDVSFSLEPGEAIGLVGESGSGKTTVGRCIAGLETPTSGTIEISTVGDGSGKQRVGMVFQEPFDSLNPRMTVGAAVVEPLLRAGVDSADAERQMIETLEMVDLSSSVAALYPFDLRPNEAQRVGVARAIVGRPSLVVLDEPTSTLDISTRLEVLKVLDRIRAELGVAYIFISHDLTAVKSLCSRVAVMYLGEIVEIGTVSEVFGAPTHPYTRALLSSVLIPDPSSNTVGFSLDQEIPSPMDLPSGCFLHPRCPLAVASCSIEHPQLHNNSGSTTSHLVACPVATGRTQHQPEKEHI